MNFAEGLLHLSVDAVSAVIALVGLIAWFVRLEAMTGVNARDIAKSDRRQEEHERKLADLDDKVMEKLASIEKIVAKIEGKLLN